MCKGLLYYPVKQRSLLPCEHYNHSVSDSERKKLAFAFARIVVASVCAHVTNGWMYLTKRLPTRLAFKRLFTGMRHFVVVKGGQLSGPSSTFFAFIRLFSSMNSCVGCQAGRVSKRMPAFAALERSLPTMKSFMSCQTGGTVFLRYEFVCAR